MDQARQNQRRKAHIVREQAADLGHVGAKMSLANLRPLEHIG